MPTQSMARSHMSYYQLLYIAPLHSVLFTGLTLRAHGIPSSRAIKIILLKVIAA